MFKHLILQSSFFFVINIQLTLSLSTGQENKTNETQSKLDNRIGLTYQHATAYGTGSKGSSYASDASYASQVGVYNPSGNSYNSILNQADTDSSASSTNDDSPLTWAQTQSVVQPGSASGHGQAGMSGGWGSSMTYGVATDAQIPLADGSILYSNFKKQPLKTNQTRQNSSIISTPKPDAIIFKND